MICCEYKHADRQHSNELLVHGLLGETDVGGVLRQVLVEGEQANERHQLLVAIELSQRVGVGRQVAKQREEIEAHGANIVTTRSHGR